MRKIFLPQHYLNHGPLELKASVLPMSYADPLIANTTQSADKMFRFLMVFKKHPHCTLFTADDKWDHFLLFSPIINGTLSEDRSDWQVCDSFLVPMTVDQRERRVAIPTRTAAPQPKDRAPEK